MNTNDEQATYAKARSKELDTIREALQEAVDTLDRKNGVAPIITNATMQKLRDAKAAADRLEAQQADIAKLVEAGDAMADNIKRMRQLDLGTNRPSFSYIEAWDAAKSATIPQQQKGPVIAHMSMDPNASDETKAAVADVVQAAYNYKPQQQPKRLTDDMIDVAAALERTLWICEGYPDNEAAAYAAGVKSGMMQARDNGYIGGLSVEDVMEIMMPYLRKDNPYWTEKMLAKLRASLTAKLNDR